MTKANIQRGQLPYGQAVIDLKRNSMKERVFAAAEGEISQDFYDLAADILGSGKPKQLLASLLQLHFGGHLNPNAYPEIREPERSGFKSKHSLERHGAPRPAPSSPVGAAAREAADSLAGRKGLLRAGISTGNRLSRRRSLPKG